ncbi:protein kinase family protein [Aspergillus ibericus CBS 121593]|uniref:Kinase-like protein n=1 Tax=Aspergillus ibericus CBS 121593 TaxID=1448316 RepID=A0A395H9C0_9EURO|nr:kinase-like protein [Aspergillus ibericus CBS 121593]RAL04452.1 kinase-like protein [Aspergillus ibericus CBS 121593]
MASLLRPRRSMKDLDDKILIDLASAMQNKATPSETFIARESLAAIWSQEILKDFIRLKKPGFRDDDIEVIREDFLQIISLLCYIGWPNWAYFGRIFLAHYGLDGRRDRTDAKIGKFQLGDLESDAFLGRPWAHKFLSDQYIFSPIVLREGESLDFSREWRLPFINEESNEIRQGGYGSVTEETIPRGYYRGPHGILSNTPVRIARKRFAIGQYFRFEVKNLKQLRSALAHHDRILPYLATVTVGCDFNIISPLADMDLEGFLSGEQGRYPNDRCFTMKDLVTEAANVADALNFLHEDLRSEELGLTCCHRDLKPANILVFFEGNMLPVGKWKITDFGISSIRQTESTNPSIRHTSVPLLGPYQAPEVCSGRESGRRSDVWSFGCILARVLALGLQGRHGLRDLDMRRGKSADGMSDYDHDYFHREVPAVLNPHIQAWVRSFSMSLHSI